MPSRWKVSAAMSNDRPNLPDRRAGSVVARVGGALVMLGASLFVMRPFLVPIVVGSSVRPPAAVAARHTRRACGAFTLAVRC
jgi:hypothetical protein